MPNSEPTPVKSDLVGESKRRAARKVKKSDTYAAPQPAHEQAGKSVLVVEDETDVRRFVKTVLERAGLRVLEAGDGIEALRVLDSISPDLVLTDIVMPEMDGIALALELAHKSPHLPILLMSGLVSDPGPTAIARGFLRKPFMPTALVEAVIEQLRRSC